MGPRVRIVSVGKTKEQWLSSAIDLYAQRLRSVIRLDCEWVKDDGALLSAVGRSADTRETVMILDERGSMCTSVEFSEILFDGLERGGSRMSIFIGGVRDSRQCEARFASPVMLSCA